MIVISEWVGRWGNNIVQIINAICIAMKYKCNVKIPDHEKFKSRIIEVGGKSDKTIYKGDCFFRNKLPFDENIFKNDKCIEIAMRSGLIDEDIIDITGKKLLIHVRSGDIFFYKKPHPYYIQPPLYFYKKIIESEKWDEILVISEDNHNPVIDELRKIPRVVCKNYDFDLSVKLLRSYKYIVLGMSCFPMVCLLFNKNIEKIFFPDYIVKFKKFYKGPGKNNETQEYLLHYIHCKKKEIKLPKYFQKLGGFWENTERQKSIMINYHP